MKKFFTLLCGIALTCGFNASAYDVVTFEDVELDENSAFTKSEYDIVISGDFLFEYHGKQGYWNGVTVANMTANTYASYADQYNTVTGGGYNGSSNYAIAYYSQYDAGVSGEYPTITGEGDTFYPEYVYVTNNAYAYSSMLNGDAYAKKFTADDYLVIHFQGVNAEDSVVSTVDFYLAKDGNIVNDWTKVDLSGLGQVAYIRCEMESTDLSYGYYNTPTYFAMDNFKASKNEPTAVSDLSSTAATVEAIYDLRGVRHSEMQQGINIVRMSDGTARKVLVK